MVINSPYVVIFDYSIKGGRLIAVVNASGDDLDEVKVSVTKDLINIPFKEIDKKGTWKKGNCISMEDNILTIKGMRRMAIRVLLFE